MSGVLLVLTDGRDDLLYQTVTSAMDNLRGLITWLVLHTDNGEAHREHLADSYTDWDVIGGPRLGFGGAISRAWGYVSSRASEEFVFHLEDDFTFNRPVDLNAMVDVLDAHPHIVQMALRRQPWNTDELRAGGIVQQHPSAYVDRSWNGHEWLEHRRFVTTNPALWRMDRIREGWPVIDRSEGMYSLETFSDPDAVSGYWGSRGSGEAVRHIGDQRVGTGY